MKLFMTPIAKRNYSKGIIVILWVSCFGNQMMNLNPVFAATLPTGITIPIHNGSFKLHPFINGTGDYGSFCFSHSFVPSRSANRLFRNFGFCFGAMGFSFKRIVCTHYPGTGIFKRLLFTETMFTTRVAVFMKLAVIRFNSLVHLFFTPKAGNGNISIHSLSYDKRVKLATLKA